MTSIVVDAQESNVSEIPESTIEPITNEAVETMEATGEVEATEEQIVDEVVDTETQEASVVPNKFAGKSPEEIIESYQNLEKELGRKAQEVGELRKLSDSFLQAQIQQAQSTPKQTKDTNEIKEEPVDFFDNPDLAINKAIENHPKFQEFQRFQAQQAQASAKTQLETTHPDYTDIVKDSGFQEWVKGSPIRMQLFQAADAYNYDAANELLTNWKDRSMINKTQEVNEQAEAERQAALKAGKAESRTSTGSATGGGKTYRRADLIRLKMNDPQKYESMENEIYKAYAEGRVK
jgi:hypothetical protein